MASHTESALRLNIYLLSVLNAVDLAQQCSDELRSVWAGRLQAPGRNLDPDVQRPNPPWTWSTGRQINFCIFHICRLLVAKPYFVTRVSFLAHVPGPRNSRPRAAEQAGLAAAEAREIAELEEQLAKMDGIKDRVVG